MFRVERRYVHHWQELTRFRTFDDAERCARNVLEANGGESRVVDPKGKIITVDIINME